MQHDVGSRYYLSLLGSWRGSLAFSLTDRAALRSSTASRLTVEGIGMVSRLAVNLSIPFVTGQLLLPRG